MTFKPDRRLPRDSDAKLRSCVRCEEEFYVAGNAVTGYAAGVLCPDCVAEDEAENGPPDVLEEIERRGFPADEEGE
jgi:hypothetical protein